jgi:hypothetical protein
MTGSNKGREVQELGWDEPRNDEVGFMLWHKEELFNMVA